MRTVLIVLSLACTAWTSILGFGFVDDAGLVEDILGWGFAGFGFYVAAALPGVDR